MSEDADSRGQFFTLSSIEEVLDRGITLSFLLLMKAICVAVLRTCFFLCCEPHAGGRKPGLPKGWHLVEPSKTDK